MLQDGNKLNDAKNQLDSLFNSQMDSQSSVQAALTIDPTDKRYQILRESL
jgi:hypothetical protein